ILRKQGTNEAFTFQVLIKVPDSEVFLWPSSIASEKQGLSFVVREHVPCISIVAFNMKFW
ncbi:hypothetical protein ACQP3D_29365, partial [Escherichia coli]